MSSTDDVLSLSLSLPYSPTISRMSQVMNSMLNAIRRKKNRDAVVLSAVGGVLGFLIFIYWLRK